MRLQNKIFRLGMLITVAAVLQYFENFLWFPGAIMGVKPGICNIVTLVAVYFFSVRDVLILAVCRSLLGSMLAGAVFGPAMIMSLSGAGFAAIGMLLCKKLISTASPVGVSACGAAFHIIAQFFAAAVIVGNCAILALMPYAGNVAMLTGIINGIIFLKLKPVFESTLSI